MIYLEYEEVKTAQGMSLRHYAHSRVHTEVMPVSKSSSTSDADVQMYKLGLRVT